MYFSYVRQKMEKFIVTSFDKKSISPFQLKKAHSSRVEIIKQCLLHNNAKLNDLQVQRDSSPNDLEVMKLVRRRQIIVSDFSYFFWTPNFPHLNLLFFKVRQLQFELSQEEIIRNSSLKVNKVLLS